MRYLAIAEDILREINEGSFAPGSKLYSIRTICGKYACTKATAIRAYEELKERGMIYALPNSGYYLIDPLTKTNAGGAEWIDFSGTSLDPGSLPYGEFQPCIEQAMRKYKEALFTYADPQGLDLLLEALRKHLQNHQVFAGTDRIFVTTGSQQALGLLAKMPFPNGKAHVAVEQPTYQGIIQSLRMNGVTAIGIARGPKGLDLACLERVFRNDNVKFFYTIPRFSNPLGYSYTNDEKQRILALADKYNVYLVEDDYLGDLEDESKSTPIFSFDASDRVVYIKTFSKVLLPGLRVAVAVLPKLLVNVFREYKHWSDLNTPLLSQGALEIYLSSGLFDAHLKKVRSLYETRMNRLKQLADTRSSSSIRWHLPSKGGFYAGIELLNGSKGSSVVEDLAGKRIRLSRIENYYLQEFYNERMLRISIANAGLDAIETGIGSMIQEIESSRAKPRSRLEL